MTLFHLVPTESKPGIYHAIIEIPKNSRVKYEFSEDFGVPMVDRLFRTPVSYPQNYGFFPQTWNKYDNDPMDVIVLCDEAFFPGAIVPVRVIGIIEMDDTGELDHKIIAVAAGDPKYKGIESIAALTEKDAEIIPNLEWFLAHYKDREPGKKVTLLGTKGPDDARKFLEECMAEYDQKHAAAHEGGCCGGHCH